ncbi:hypothetical protein NCCP2495_25390 [Dietzia sp. NCCP-2495]|uniref:HtaA domain-containing protein n=1 Tax=Dietzia sp. NCCP-2495 TaxID=2934675 RepID=UPI0022302A57|nr:HtaA domain-containing protein [Dietzia sp. NCCP-2495]GLB64660.1 hypothetical protein NCCP2495_25390 [Dietzia sp. NCCP-2495]
MNRLSLSLVRDVFALTLALVLAVGVIAWAPTARAQEGGVVGEGGDESSVFEVDNAEFRWGINKQSAGPSHGPGINFLAAGNQMTVTDPTGSNWKAREGQVTIEKRVDADKVALATWDGANTDQQGRKFKTSGSTNYSGLEMVFAGGEGIVDREAGTAEISWSGSASIIYYSGLVRLLISDPVLTVTPSGGTIVATMGGVKSDRDTTSSSGLLTPKNVVIADWESESGSLDGEKGFSAIPEYLKVPYTAPAGADPQSTTGDNWGAFPEGFMKVAEEAGSAGFWYSTGTNPANDATKIPEAVTISWDADDSADVPSSGTGSKGVLGQVLDDTVEDILRAAGTDVSDTAAAWMDEAWKPLQPGAATAAQGAQGAGGGTAVVDSAVDDAVLDEEFAYAYEEYYSAGTPMTAGTVGAVAANSSGGSAGASSPAPSSSAPASVADPGTTPVAATLPLTDVVYSNASASPEAGNTLPQWQWWVGGILLALAAGLFYPAVLRKD